MSQSAGPASCSIAYFSMEIAVESCVPTYSGGLGVLAGDTIRAAADMKLPMAGISLLYRGGFFTQRLAADGTQYEEPVVWRVEDYLKEEAARATIRLDGRPVELRCWRYDVVGTSGFGVPVYFLDADLPSNDPTDRALTGTLYGGDRYYRLCQEVVLGMGGFAMLRALGYSGLLRYHMNEGHASFLAVDLLNEEAAKAGRRSIRAEDVEAVRRKCIFTTHTPVPAGHDRFPLEMVGRIFRHRPDFLDPGEASATALLNKVVEGGTFANFADAVNSGATLNMTNLALYLSGYVNGVTRLHSQISRKLLNDERIDAVTNGVHVATWASPSLQKLFDQRIPGWREDNSFLRMALGLPQDELWAAHLAGKQQLLETVHVRTGLTLDPDAFTIGFARRATAYKRADLVFGDLDRLKDIAAGSGAFQFVFAGKAHPSDAEGKELIRRIYRAKKALRRELRIAYLDDYNMEIAAKMTAGVDLWLNTPQYPLEASGTSGMKAAVNGVPSLSVLDGWWTEGHIEGVTGWSIGGPRSAGAPDPGASGEMDSLYRKLQDVILPLYYKQRPGYISVMQHAIAINGAFFNTQRMLQQYVSRAYFR